MKSENEIEKLFQEFGVKSTGLLEKDSDDFGWEIITEAKKLLKRLKPRIMNLPKANSRDFKKSVAILLEWWFGISLCLGVLPLISQSRKRLRELKGETVAFEKENRELEVDERKLDEKRRELLKGLSEAGLHLRLVKPTDPGEWEN